MDIYSVIPSAAAAAAAAGCLIRPLTAVPQVHDASALLNALWGDDRLTNPGMLRAIERAGGYLVGAYVAEQMVGASIAFLGRHHDEGRRVTILHSHITGVRPPASGIGTAIKLHQREWCRGQDITAVSWTFDPLVARNAYFNLGKLGATGRAYLIDHYGQMDDDINAGDATDRLLAWWPVDDAPRLQTHTQARIVRLLSVGEGQVPVAEAALHQHLGDVLQVQVPSDIEGLRRRDLPLALRWRTAIRQTVGQALDSGYEATGMLRDGTYVLTPG